MNQLIGLPPEKMNLIIAYLKKRPYEKVFSLLEILKSAVVVDVLPPKEKTEAESADASIDKQA